MGTNAGKWVENSKAVFYPSGKHLFVWKQNFRQGDEQKSTTIIPVGVWKQKSEISSENVTRVPEQK